MPCQGHDLSEYHTHHDLSMSKNQTKNKTGSWLFMPSSAGSFFNELSIRHVPYDLKKRERLRLHMCC